jgi:hypothetical protein
MNVLTFPDSEQVFFASDELLGRMRAAHPDREFTALPVPKETALAIDLSTRLRAQPKSVFERHQEKLSDREKANAQRIAKTFARKRNG